MRELPRGGRARLMCEKHPSGPLDIPDPACYSDTQVSHHLVTILFTIFQGYEKCFSLCKYTLSLIIKELRRLLDVADPRLPTLGRTQKELKNSPDPVQPIVLLPQKPLLFSAYLPPASPSPPQPPPSIAEDTVNHPSKVKALEEWSTDEHCDIFIQRRDREVPKLPLLWRADFPWKSGFADVDDCVNFSKTLTKTFQEEIMTFITLQYHPLYYQIDHPNYQPSPSLEPPQPPNTDLADVHNPAQRNPRVSPRTDCFGLPTLFALSVNSPADVIKTLVSATNISIFMPPSAPFHQPLDKSLLLPLQPPQEPAIDITDNLNKRDRREKLLDTRIMDIAFVYIPLSINQDVSDNMNSTVILPEASVSRRPSRRISSSDLEPRTPCQRIKQMLSLLVLEPPQPPSSSSEPCDVVNRSSVKRVDQEIILFHPKLDLNILRAEQDVNTTRKSHFQLEPPQESPKDIEDTINKPRRPRSDQTHQVIDRNVGHNLPSEPKQYLVIRNFKLEPPQETTIEISDFVNPPSRRPSILLATEDNFNLSITLPTDIGEPKTKQTFQLEAPQTPPIYVKDFLNQPSKNRPNLQTRGDWSNLNLTLMTLGVEFTRPNLLLQPPQPPPVQISDSLNPISNIKKLWQDQGEVVLLIAIPTILPDQTNLLQVCLEPPQPPNLQLDDIPNKNMTKLKQLETPEVQNVCQPDFSVGLHVLNRIELDKSPLQTPTVEVEDEIVQVRRKNPKPLDNQTNILMNIMCVYLYKDIDSNNKKPLCFLDPPQPPALELEDYILQRENYEKNLYEHEPSIPVCIVTQGVHQPIELNLLQKFIYNHDSQAPLYNDLMDTVNNSGEVKQIVSNDVIEDCPTLKIPLVIEIFEYACPFTKCSPWHQENSFCDINDTVNYNENRKLQKLSNEENSDIICSVTGPTYINNFEKKEKIPPCMKLDPPQPPSIDPEDVNIRERDKQEKYLTFIEVVDGIQFCRVTGLEISTEARNIKLESPSYEPAQVDDVINTPGVLKKQIDANIMTLAEPILPNPPTLNTTEVVKPSIQLEGPPPAPLEQVDKLCYGSSHHPELRLVQTDTPRFYPAGHIPSENNGDSPFLCPPQSEAQTEAQSLTFAAKSFDVTSSDSMPSMEHLCREEAKHTSYDDAQPRSKHKSHVMKNMDETPENSRSKLNLDPTSDHSGDEARSLIRKSDKSSDLCNFLEDNPDNPDPGPDILTSTNIRSTMDGNIVVQHGQTDNIATVSDSETDLNALFIRSDIKPEKPTISSKSSSRKETSDSSDISEISTFSILGSSHLRSGSVDMESWIKSEGSERGRRGRRSNHEYIREMKKKRSQSQKREKALEILGCQDSKMTKLPQKTRGSLTRLLSVSPPSSSERSSTTSATSISPTRSEATVSPTQLSSDSETTSTGKKYKKRPNVLSRLRNSAQKNPKPSIDQQNQEPSINISHTDSSSSLCKSDTAACRQCEGESIDRRTKSIKTLSNSNETGPIKMSDSNVAVHESRNPAENSLSTCQLHGVILKDVKEMKLKCSQRISRESSVDSLRLENFKTLIRPKRTPRTALSPESQLSGSNTEAGPSNSTRRSGDLFDEIKLVRKSINYK